MIEKNGKKITVKDMAIECLMTAMCDYTDYLYEKMEVENCTEKEKKAIFEAMNKEICNFHKKHEKRLDKLALLD